jgi:hypothetical protein
MTDRLVVGIGRFTVIHNGEGRMEYLLDENPWQIKDPNTLILQMATEISTLRKRIEKQEIYISNLKILP